MVSAWSEDLGVKRRDRKLCELAERASDKNDKRKSRCFINWFE